MYDLLEIRGVAYLQGDQVQGGCHCRSNRNLEFHFCPYSAVVLPGVRPYVAYEPLRGTESGQNFSSMTLVHMPITMSDTSGRFTMGTENGCRWEMRYIMYYISTTYAEPTDQNTSKCFSSTWDKSLTDAATQQRVMLTGIYTAFYAGALAVIKSAWWQLLWQQQ